MEVKPNRQFDVTMTRTMTSQTQIFVDFYEEFHQWSLHKQFVLSRYTSEL